MRNCASQLLGRDEHLLALPALEQPGLRRGIRRRMARTGRLRWRPSDWTERAREVITGPLSARTIAVKGQADRRRPKCCLLSTAARSRGRRRPSALPAPSRNASRPLERDRQVRPAEAEPEVVAGVAEAASRAARRTPSGLDERGGEVVDRTAAEEAREADRAATRTDPGDRVRPALEEGVEQREVVGDDRARPGQDASRGPAGAISARISDGADEQIVV